VGPADAVTKLNDFSEALRLASSHGQPLFKSITTPPWQRRNNDITWSITAELAKGESD
jgi:hypothetical protein